MVHVNPLASNDGATMSWRDAALVSVVIMLAAYFLQFLVPITYEQIAANPGEFVYNSLRFLGTTFFGSLAALKGLSKFVGAKKE